MKKDTNVLTLLLGIAIPVVLMPIINNLIELFDGRCEIIKGGQIEKITKLNINNTKLQYELEELQSPVSSNAIGFEVPSEEDYYDEEEIEEDKVKNKIGF